LRNITQHIITLFFVNSDNIKHYCSISSTSVPQGYQHEKLSFFTELMLLLKRVLSVSKYAYKDACLQLPGNNDPLQSLNNLVKNAPSLPPH